MPYLTPNFSSQAISHREPTEKSEASSWWVAPWILWGGRDVRMQGRAGPLYGYGWKGYETLSYISVYFLWDRIPWVQGPCTQLQVTLVIRFKQGKWSAKKPRKYLCCATHADINGRNCVNCRSWSTKCQSYGDSPWALKFQVFLSNDLTKHSLCFFCFWFSGLSKDGFSHAAF